jgi:hypothetical protein
MRLAKAVMRGDTPFLREGTELSEALIGRLCSMGVESVAVEDVGVSGNGAGDGGLPGPEFYLRRVTRLKRVFRSGQHVASPERAAWMRSVQNAIEAYLIQRLAEAHARGKPGDRADD